MTADSGSSRSRSFSPPPRPSSHKNGTKESKSHRKVTKSTRIIQVANIAPQANREQMITLFGYIGKIDDLRLYPTVDLGQMSSKICFVKFYEKESVGVAQHLTNTVFIDRALIVTSYMEGEIPDEQLGLELMRTGSVLPGVEPKLPQHVTSQIEGMHPHQVVVTVDPTLLENNLPSYPPIPFLNNDTRKIEEIRRTLLVANLDPDLTSDEVMEFFGQAGEVKYFRFCTRDNDPLRYALIEFSQQPSILEALRRNGEKLGNKYIKVYHSTQAITKPQAKTNEAAQKEIEEAMSRQAQNIISQGLDDHRKRSRSRSHSRRRSRSRGRSHRRSRSRSRRRSSRSRSKRRSSSRSRHTHRSTKSKKSRSRSPKRSKSGSRDRRSSYRSKKRSKSRERRKKTRSRSPVVKLSRSPVVVKRSRSRSKKREDKVEKLKKSKKVKKEKDRSKERERGKDKDNKERQKDKDRERGRDRDREKDRGRDKDREETVSSSKGHDERDGVEYKENRVEPMDLQDDSN